ncbi:MAG: sortase [Candidatus Doudnabacteria bacterium]|nr:sortase [Candidatus Doudnabacteria bacterium]
MPLKTYRKAMPAYVDVAGYTPTFYFEPPAVTVSDYPPNMWSMLAGFYRGLKNLVATYSAAGLFIPAILVVAGGLVNYHQFLPNIVTGIRDASGYYNQGTVSLVSDNYIVDKLKFISNPGADYFNKINSALSQGLGAIDPAIKEYAGTMYLTIPSLGFNRLPITANVESNSKEIYDQVLTSSLAHFKGTSLPFADKIGNTVIYGHSASGSYNPSPTDVLAAFSFLSELKAGDTIMLEVAGQTYKYQMYRSKIVKPEDVSVLDSQGRDTLTLITCHPPGNNSQRYVAVATKVN